jgi:hypothetical protein
MQALPMRALKAAVIVMGVLILAGVAVIVVTIVHRMSGTGARQAPGPSAQQEGVPEAGALAAAPTTLVQTVLDEPAGTRITGAAASVDRLALQLQGGGPDRVVVVDTRAGRVVARVALAR